jgi:hypothetical protein
MIGQVLDPPVGAAFWSGDVVAAGVVAAACSAAAVSDGGSRSPGGVTSDAADVSKGDDLLSEVRSGGAVKAGADLDVSAAVS